MEYTANQNTIIFTQSSLLKKIFMRLKRNKSPLENQIDGLKSDYAIALDQCQLMKQHIQDLEFKIDNMSASIDLRSDSVEQEMPYSTAIILAKRGCSKEEIREACGLTDSEADLILALHNKPSDNLRSSMIAY